MNLEKAKESIVKFYGIEDMEKLAVMSGRVADMVESENYHEALEAIELCKKACGCETSVSNVLKLSWISHELKDEFSKILETVKVSIENVEIMERLISSKLIAA